MGCEVEKNPGLIKGEPYTFTIVQMDGKKFVLCAKSEEEMNEWYVANQAHRKQLELGVFYFMFVRFCFVC